MENNFLIFEYPSAVIFTVKSLISAIDGSFWLGVFGSWKIFILFDIICSLKATV